MIDPATGLPVDENGKILGPAEAGSDHISESDQPPDIQVPSALSTPETHPAADIPAPWEQPQAPTAPGASHKQQQDVSGSYHGVTKQGLAVTDTLNARADKAARSDVAQYDKRYAQESQDYDRVAEEQRQANDLELQAHTQHQAEQSKIFQAQMGFATEQAELEKHAYAQSQVVRQQYMTAYEQDLGLARQLSMSSGDPYATMDKTTEIGLIAQHAVAGFLKVGGHDLGIEEQTDRWVNREIAKHAQLVQNTRQNAQDKFHLYSLAKQNAMDDYEARERYRGMVMEGLKSQLQMEGARYGSQLAVATAAQKAAEIDTHLVTVKSNLADRQQKLYFDAQKMRIDQAAEQARNSVASYSAHTGRMQEERLAKEAEAKAKAAPEDQYFPVYDPFEPNVPGKTQPKWLIEKDDKDAMKQFREKETATRSIASQLENLEALRKRAYDKLGGAPVIGAAAGKLGAAASEIREYQRARRAAIATIRKGYSGAAFTEAESKEYESLLPGETFWESGNNETAIPQLREKIRTDFQASADSYSAKGKGTVAGPMRAAEHEAMMSPDGEKSSVPGRMVASMDDPKIQKETKEPSRAFEALMGPGDWKKGSEPKKFEVPERLAKMVLAPAYARREEGGAGLPDSDDLMRAQAREALQRIAADPDVKDAYLSGYARMMLDQIDESPDDLAGLLGIRQVKVDESSWSMSGAPANK